MSKPLNIRQQRFCEFIAAGEKPADAWLKAGYEVTRYVAQRNAQESLSKPVISARIAELRKPVTKKLLLSKDRKRELLRDIAEDGDRPPMVRIRAIEIDAKLAGHFEPDRVDLESRSFNLESAKERAMAIASSFDRNAWDPKMQTENVKPAESRS